MSKICSSYYRNVIQFWLTFNLLHGTEFMPDLKDAILFLEDDGMADRAFMWEFDRNLQSLIMQKDFDKVKAIVIGRAEIN